MNYIFYYFLKSALTGAEIRNPLISFSFVGEVGEYIELDGVGYFITDYATEVVDAEGDSLYW